LSSEDALKALKALKVSEIEKVTKDDRRVSLVDVGYVPGDVDVGYVPGDVDVGYVPGDVDNTTKEMLLSVEERLQTMLTLVTKERVSAALKESISN